MGVPGGRENPPVSEQLLQEPWRFGFHQATRLLEWIAVHRRVPEGGAARYRASDGSVGEDVPAGREAVRFRAAVSARFPADEVLAIQSSDVSAGKRQSLDPPELLSRTSVLAVAGRSRTATRAMTTPLTR